MRTPVLESHSICTAVAQHNFVQHHHYRIAKRRLLPFLSATHRDAGRRRMLKTVLKKFGWSKRPRHDGSSEPGSSGPGSLPTPSPGRKTSITSMKAFSELDQGSVYSESFSSASPTWRRDSRTTDNSDSRSIAMSSMTMFGKDFLPTPTSVKIGHANMVDNSYNIHTTNNGNYGLQLLRTNMAPSALHNSRERFDPPKCDEDTRVGLLDEVSDWVKNRNADAPNTYILAMTGPAGSGKSALMQTLTERSAAVGILLASFFFSATDSRRNNKERFVATIAYQIAQSITAAREPITRAVELDPSIFDRTMETQIETLIVEPLKEVMTHSNGNWEKLPYSIFIDGIDECQGEEHQSHLLRVFEGLVLKSQLPLKLCFSSRPEFAVRSAISEDGHLTQTKLLYLIELSEHDARADIHRTLQRRLREIGKHSEDPRATSDTWPSQEDLDTLVENSSGQYIYAATVIKFLSDRRRSPVKRMEAILAWTPGMQQREKPFAVLDNLYTNIFMSALKAYRGEDAPDEDLTIIRSLHMIRLWG
ncbi:hypothetical protein FA15DRAFT_761338 [Coprinopsis marcescibilis]|uniref:Nephrocystin 3-like N-terminal domain-containing protein n=1 Tax=Coprinopsis marcescibilis TaxID=230819 RepID=A0A5C3KAH0_COPMA|nr:hypothetical protein FA15DRAFT_761338 [Coprinopsis marcescibilis]